jgi:hypothetical protein
MMQMTIFTIDYPLNTEGPQQASQILPSHPFFTVYSAILPFFTLNPNLAKFFTEVSVLIINLK